MTVRGAVRTGGAAVVRQVVLGERLPDGWHRVAATMTDHHGDYRLRVPTNWYNSNEYAVFVPPTAEADEAWGGEWTLVVNPAYRPAGAKSSWSWGQRHRSRWNPCETVTFRVNRRAAVQPGAVGDTRTAVRQLSAATGVRFKYLGRTTAIPGSSRRWPSDTDMVVAWARPSQTSWDLSGSVAGRGGPTKSVSAHDAEGALHQAVKGGVVMDAPAERSFTRTVRMHILQHELAHVVGLGHTTGKHQIMQARAMDTSGPARYGAGDLTGMHKVGLASGCVYS